MKIAEMAVLLRLEWKSQWIRVATYLIEVEAGCGVDSGRTSFLEAVCSGVNIIVRVAS